QTTQEGHVKGKLGYMAPELLDKHEVTRLSDVYAAGVVLWESLTGKKLFEARTEGEMIHKILSATIEKPSGYTVGVSSDLDAIVMRALDRDPKQRFPTARD